MEVIPVCVFCHNLKPVKGSYYEVNSRNFFICDACESSKRVLDNKTLKNFDMNVLGGADFVLVLGERKSGRKILCSRFFNNFSDGCQPVLLYDSPREICDAIPRHGCAVVSTVLPSEDSPRKPTYIVFTPALDIEWDTHMSVVKNMCGTFGIPVVKELEDSLQMWRSKYNRHALVVNASTGATTVLQI